MNLIPQNNRIKKYISLIALLSVCLLFFYQTLLFGKFPFPGDLLLTQYAPWRHQSYLGYVQGAVPSKDQYFDVIREIYPWKTLVVNQLKHGRLPLWNPYNFSGAPLLANYQSQVFYPLTVVYFLLPQIIAWTVMVILQPVLGSVFLYLFATEIGLSASAAFLASLFFNFSSFANVWMEFTTIWHTILWLPLLLYIIEGGIKQKKLFIGQQIIFVTGLCCAMTGGHPQDFINSFLFLTLYIVLRIGNLSSWSRHDKVSFFINPLAIILGIPFFIAAPQLFPTIELFRHSARVAHDYQGIVKNMLVQWWQFPLIAVQDFFGNPATKSNFTGDYVGKTLSIGVTGFFLALTAIVSNRTSWHKKFFVGLAIAILLVTIRTPFTELLYRYPQPILSTGTPTRILFLFMFALSMLAGYGFDALKQDKNNLGKPLISIWIFFIMLWIFTFMHPALSGISNPTLALSIMKRAMVFATGIVGVITLVLVATQYKKVAIWVLMPLCVGELLYGFIKFNPFVPKDFIFPKNTLITHLQKTTGIDRFWGYGTGGMEANFATQEYIYSPDGTDPLNLSWYNQLTQSSRDGKIEHSFNRTTRSDAYLAPGYGLTDLPSNEFRLRLMDVLGVKYIIDRAENPKDGHTFPSDRFREAWHQNDWTIYENLKSSPRFFVTSDVRPYTDAADFESQFYGKDFQPGKTVLLEKHDWESLPKFINLDRPNKVNIHTYEPTKIVVTVTTDTPQFLFVSDTYDAGWTAIVNDIPTRVYKVDYALRGVVIPKGSARVVFTYEPKSLHTGLAISAVSILFFIIYCFFMRRTDDPLPKTKQRK